MKTVQYLQYHKSWNSSLLYGLLGPAHGSMFVRNSVCHILKLFNIGFFELNIMRNSVHVLLRGK